MKTRRLLTSIPLLLALFLLSDLVSAPPAQAFTARNLAYGSQGNNVYELQNRLRFLGYYWGKIDGNFGWDTYWAVRTFQYNFGMKVTGFVDMATKIRLVEATQGWKYTGPTANSPSGASASGAIGGGPAATGTANGNGGTATGTSNANANPGTPTSNANANPGTPTSNANANGSPSASSAAAVAQTPPVVNGISSSDLNLMAHVVYGEARGEPFMGQVAVAAVVLNRLKDPRFPHSIPAIIYQPGAFTCVSDGQFNLQPDATAMQAVLDAVHGWDPCLGAVYYFNPATATSSWIWSRPEIIQIGKHIFCR